MPWMLIFLVVLGSLLQIVLGILLGGYFARQRRTGPAAVKRNSRLVRLAGRVHTLLQGMENDVDAHQGEIAAIEEELSTVSPGGSADSGSLVMQIIRNIFQSNSRLLGRLHASEEKLRVQRVQLEEHCVKARTDPLTNLHNRRAFDEALVHKMEHWRRSGVEFGLILIDLDFLKTLNDRGGHLTGDYALRTLGELLRCNLSEHDFAARMGGDEFALLVVDSDLEETCRRAEAIRAAVEKHRFCFEQRQWPVSVSIGAAQIRPSDKGTDLIRRTDHALVEAKRAGRNCCYFHDGHLCHPVIPTEKAVPDDLLHQLCDDLRQRMATVVEQ
jgi:diguanylate cyclase